MTAADKSADWSGLTQAQATLIQRLLGGAMAKYLPPGTDFSIACVIFTSRPGDLMQAADFLAASTIPWNPIDALEEWLDNHDED